MRISFGKNEQVKKVFWTLFISMARLVQARVVDPVTVRPGTFGVLTRGCGYIS